MFSEISIFLPKGVFLKVCGRHLRISNLKLGFYLFLPIPLVYFFYRWQKVGIRKTFLFFVFFLIKIKKRRKFFFLRLLIVLKKRLSSIVFGLCINFIQQIDLVGVGYKADFSANFILFKLGFSHRVVFSVPTFISVFCFKGVLFILSCSSKELLGVFVSRMQRFKTSSIFVKKGLLCREELFVKKKIKKK